METAGADGKTILEMRTTKADYHPNMDGPAEPIGLSLPNAEVRHGEDNAKHSK